MTDLLESHLLWTSLGWLCLLGLALWLITVLFPVPSPSDDRSLEESANPEPKKSAPPMGANHNPYK
jgi:hypothetical protein